MRIALFDTETTGLPIHFEGKLSLQPRIIEFGGVVTENGEIVAEISQIINPQMQIEEIITKITGLKQSDVDSGMLFKDFMPEAATFFAGCDAVIAHNLAFDKFLLQCEMERMGMTLDDVHFPALQVCSVQETSPSYGYRMSLEKLYTEHVGEYKQTHRALDDVKLMLAVCRKVGIIDVLGRIK